MEVCAAYALDRGIEVGYLVLERCHVGVYAVVEVARVVAPAHFDFPALVAYVTGVHRRGVAADNERGYGAVHKQVLGLFV